MIDRGAVQNYNTKGRKDREQEIDELDHNQAHLSSERNEGAGYRTPQGYETPYAMGSIRAQQTPISIYGGGMQSPGFQTPLYSYSHR